MYHAILPRCTVIGPVDPVPYSHFLSGSVPRKCIDCPLLFEGGCRRSSNAVHAYMQLDHGACPVAGSTIPTTVENQYYTSKVLVPKKCVTCRYLELDSIRGFVCNMERKTWGAFPRSLDWSSWTPEHPEFRLDSGRSVTYAVTKAVADRNESDAVKFFREAHPSTTIREARDAFAELSRKFRSHAV